VKAGIEPLDSCCGRRRLERGTRGGQRGIELSGPQCSLDGSQTMIRHTFV
jgi:hypothetical protein